MITFVFSLIALLLLFIPPALLIFAAIKMLKVVKDYSGILIAIGAGILAVTSLDFLYTAVSGHLLDAQGLATYTIYTTYIFRGLNFVALILISIGLLRLSKRIATIQL